jgi:enoyl-CoA hydratase/carnithine racemase
MLNFSLIDVEHDSDHVLTATVNRPEALNAFNLQMRREFAALWSHVKLEDSIHAVVMRAAPGRAFCTGADSKDLDGVLGSDNIWSQVDPGEQLGPKHNKCWKPVITAVHGMAAGGAFYWINESDLVICSDDATFFDPHVTYGAISAVEPIGMTYRLPLGEVLRMALLGNDERISAQTAQRIGLVSEVVPLEQLWPRARELAGIIASKPPAAIQGTVRAIWESLDLNRTIALQTALKYCQLGNPVGMAQVDREAALKARRKFSIR